MIEGAISDENGNIAIKYYQTIPKIVKVGGSEYLFQVRANICMAWIPEEYGNIILAKTKVCCGGNKRKVFRLANENDVRRWTVGGGR